MGFAASLRNGGTGWHRALGDLPVRSSEAMSGACGSLVTLALAESAAIRADQAASPAQRFAAGPRMRRRGGGVGMEERGARSGGAEGGFPATRVSAVVRSASPDPLERREALEQLLGAYWKPVYKYVRVRWGAAAPDAEDLTQGFFARAMDKGFFERFDPARGRFRAFLRTALDGYVQNERVAAGRLKRGGGERVLSLDFHAAEEELGRSEVAGAEDLERFFHREWVRELFAVALERLRERLARKPADWELFRRYDLEPEGGVRPTYEALARELGLSVPQVANRLAAVRGELRRLVRSRLAEVCADAEEARLEARELFGGDEG